MNIRAIRQTEHIIKSQGENLIFEHSSGSIEVPIKSIEAAIKRAKEGTSCVD